MIHISKLQFSYPNSDFSLEIEKMQIERTEALGIIGPSGTGKTTFLNLIAGVLAADSGEITTHAAAISKMTDGQRRDFRIRNVGMIFQEFELLEYLSVRDNILLPYRMSSALCLNPEVLQRVESLAEQTGIVDQLKRPVGKLSQGERQRVAFCRAVLPDPPLLLADEPTGNLDPESTERVLDILFQHVRAAGATLITVTHERSYLDRFDRVLDFSAFRKAGIHA